jgi:hypothetical protein
MRREQMKILMDITIMTNGGEKGIPMRKEVEFDFIPPPNVEFDEPVWDAPKIPTKYTINFNEKFVLLHFGSDSSNDGKTIEAYRADRWKRLSEL